MRCRAFVGAFTLICVGVVLGATALREEIAYAAQAVSAEIVGPLDDRGNVKVHEQGTVDVNVTNRAVEVSGAVTVGSTTQKILETPPGGLTTSYGVTKREIGTVDTADFAQIRISGGMREETGYPQGAFLHVDFEDTGDRVPPLLETDFAPEITRVLDVPGTKLHFWVEWDENAFDVGTHTVDVTVWGR